MNAADSVISNLVTSTQNLENTVDELKTDLKKAKAESRASAGQRMHHLPPAAMTGDLKMARDDRSNNRPIVQDENVCQPYGARSMKLSLLRSLAIQIVAGELTSRLAL